MNNPLEKLLEWRLENIIERFDINLENFHYRTLFQVRKNQWDILNQKLLSCGYITEEDNIFNSCYYVIKNIVWKNIINYVLIENKCHVHMLWNGYTIEYGRCEKYSYMVRDLILNINTRDRIKTKKNLNILYSTIIHYLLLLNEIVSHNLIVDLTNILNMYIFDVILVI